MLYSADETNYFRNSNHYYGINDDFIKEVGATFKPDDSALFLLIPKWTEGKALDRFKKFNSKVVRKSLSNEDELNSKQLLVLVSIIG